MSNVRTQSVPATRNPMMLALALAAVFALSFALAMPVRAETSGQASTRNIALGAAAAAIGIVIYNNIQHKNAAANQVVGYTRDGGTVYADGRIVYPNGNVLYSSNGNGRVCSWNGNGERCGNRPVAYHTRDWNGHDNWNHNGSNNGQNRNDDHWGPGSGGNDRDGGANRDHGQHGSDR